MAGKYRVNGSNIERAFPIRKEQFGPRSQQVAALNETAITRRRRLPFLLHCGLFHWQVTRAPPPSHPQLQTQIDSPQNPPCVPCASIDARCTNAFASRFPLKNLESPTAASGEPRGNILCVLHTAHWALGVLVHQPTDAHRPRLGPLVPGVPILRGAYA